MFKRHLFLPGARSPIRLVVPVAMPLVASCAVRDLGRTVASGHTLETLPRKNGQMHRRSRVGFPSRSMKSSCGGQSRARGWPGSRSAQEGRLGQWS